MEKDKQLSTSLESRLCLNTFMPPYSIVTQIRLHYLTSNFKNFLNTLAGAAILAAPVLCFRIVFPLFSPVSVSPGLDLLIGGPGGILRNGPLGADPFQNMKCVLPGFPPIERTAGLFLCPPPPCDHTPWAWYDARRNGRCWGCGMRISAGRASWRRRWAWW